MGVFNQDLTETEKRNLNLLLEYEPSLRRYDTIFNKHVSLGDTEFIIQTDNEAIERQYIHILAFLNGYYSKTVMSDYNYGCYGGKCSRCYYRLRVSDQACLDPSFCCELCNGICPFGCRHSYKDAYNMSSGKCWNGSILISKTKLKLGRKKRKQINRYRNGIKSINDY